MTSPSEKVLDSTVDFWLMATQLHVRKVDDRPLRGYAVVNKHTGITEMEGTQYHNSLVGLHYLQAEYTRVLADPLAEIQRRALEPSDPFSALMAQANKPDAVN